MGIVGTELVIGGEVRGHGEAWLSVHALSFSWIF